MRLPQVLIGIAAGSVVASCTVGSGDVTTVERSVSDFDEIVLMTSGKAVVQVTGTESLLIEAEENIVPLLTSEVEGGRLILDSDGSFSSTRGVTYTITAAELAGIQVTGSGDVEATAIDASTFLISITGSGSIEPSGRCETLAVEISGSGTLSGSEFECAIGQVSVSGSGYATTNVTDELHALVSGSGTIEYIGEPELRSEVTGSGDVVQN